MDLQPLILTAAPTRRLLGRDWKRRWKKIAMEVDDIGIRTQSTQCHMKPLRDVSAPSLPGAASSVPYWVGEESHRSYKARVSLEREPRFGRISQLTHHTSRF